VLSAMLANPTAPSAAADAAAAAQHARVELAKALPADMQSARPGADLWSKFGGPAIEAMLGDIDLVDARYLVDLAERRGVLPRWQDVPPAARIGPSEVWRLRFAWHEYDCLAILALSYPWLDREHPDRMGEMLRRVAPILRAMLATVASEHGTVGVMWDFASLPQHPRSADESARFYRGLAKMYQWYMHPFTHVLILGSALPTSCEYANSRPWDRRGWCCFEGCASALIKHEYCLWDDRSLTGEYHGRVVRRDGAPQLHGLRQTLRAGRRAPLSPSAFAEMVERRVADGSLAFTSERNDKALVIDLYRTGFVQSFDTFPCVSVGHNIISFFGLGFGTEEQIAQLADALAYVAQHCSFPHGPVRISCEGNGISKAGMATLRETLAGCSGVEALYL